MFRVGRNATRALVTAASAATTDCAAISARSLRVSATFTTVSSDRSSACADQAASLAEPHARQKSHQRIGSDVRRHRSRKQPRKQRRLQTYTNPHISTKTPQFLGFDDTATT